MSEFTHHKQNRVKMLVQLTKAILKKENVGDLYKQYLEGIQKLMPSDIIAAVDALMQEKIELEALKTAINKLLNLVYQPINDFPSTPVKKGDILWYLEQNNIKAISLLEDTSQLIKKLNSKNWEESVQELLSIYKELLAFTKIYTIKENVVFPVLEKEWPDFRCSQLMWAFHDDIKRDIKEVISILEAKGVIDLSRINRLIGDVSFRITAIKFRDEKILFPHILDTISTEKVDGLLSQSKDLEFPFVKPDFNSKQEESEASDMISGLVQLGSGAMRPDQIKMVFNHLPVDITYVDEHNKVQYYSTPKHRIFPRTNAILGRDVSNCHPPDSVHVVEKIVEAFRIGEKDQASFWIHMGPHFVLIQYFAVRDEDSVFRGVVEVSQEISEIVKLEGDKRLLDWE
ncbi:MULTISPECIES: PAS domain-containing protein [unclassified Lentimicrobium]|uniref:PAS domain-containing protein n=1 Tax=unclassified Lentimicrobium TaxID=2677434 RepID=UPI00155573AF|nr:MULTISPECIES: PAS domain-containing protein [unclassified Lentimicrobium]NPD46010.1 DUF438 domain-containing protein [Lentimicrobium sp. S6]NPD85210.1 DUF438 domain-containing protein [Lentimicrobium sp. L6]